MTGTVDSNAVTTAQPAPAAGEAKTLVMIIYGLYFAGFFVGLTAIAGVIMAHIKSGEVSEPWRSHLQYQVRTFWLGLATLVVAALSSFILIGYVVGLWWLVWTLVRCIKGVLRASEGRGIDNPTTFLW